jgi:hypothetical protein
VIRVERNRGWGRAFEKAVRRKPLARRTRALCKLNGARGRCWGCRSGHGTAIARYPPGIPREIEANNVIAGDTAEQSTGTKAEAARFAELSLPLLARKLGRGVHPSHHIPELSSPRPPRRMDARSRQRYCRWARLQDQGGSVPDLRPAGRD